MKPSNVQNIRSQMQSENPLTEQEFIRCITEAFLAALRLKDEYTYYHCRRVSYYATNLAKACGFSEEEVNLVEYSALLHDIGKIGIPDSVLSKPGKLDPQELATIRKHSTYGRDILMPLSRHPFFSKIIPGVYCHHERVDGMGYPNQIKGDEIPLIARVILVVDTFDAITTTRPYRKAQEIDKAYAEIVKYGGTQFDEKMVDIFLKAHPTWQPFSEDQEWGIIVPLKIAA